MRKGDLYIWYHAKMRSENSEIHCPDEDEVRKYLKIWDDDENYRKPAEALQKLFAEYLPANKHISDILIKTYALNDAYRTNLRGRQIVTVAKHIKTRNIDVDLLAGKSAVVDEIRTGHGVTTKKDTEINFYVFATKYCSFHNSDKYPIFDSNVETALIHFKRHCGFEFNGDLRKYEDFVCVIENFKKNFGLDFTFRDIDKYLYLVGRKLNPPKKKA